MQSTSTWLFVLVTDDHHEHFAGRQYCGCHDRARNHEVLTSGHFCKTMQLDCRDVWTVGLTEFLGGPKEVGPGRPAGI